MSHSDPELSTTVQIIGEGPLIGEEIEVMSGSSSLLGSSTLLPSSSFSIFKSPISNISFPSSSAPRKYGDGNTIQIGRHKFTAMGSAASSARSAHTQRNNRNSSNTSIFNLSALSPAIQMIKQEPIFCQPNATYIPIESVPFNFSFPIQSQLGNFAGQSMPITESVEGENIVVMKAEEATDMQILELDESQIANFVGQQQFKVQDYDSSIQNYGQFILCDENPVDMADLFSNNTMIITKEPETGESQDYSVSTLQKVKTPEKKISKKNVTPTTPTIRRQELQMESDGNVTEIRKRFPDFKCQETSCGRIVNNVQDLRNHLSHEHGVTFMEEQKHFESEEEFKLWKSEYEKDHQVSFIYRGGTKKISADKAVTYLICHRSGTYKSTVDGETLPINESPRNGSARKRKLKPQGSCKIGTYCTAGIKLLKNLHTNGIEASICHTHYAHDIMNPKHLRMNATLKQEIWAKFDSGLTFGEILQQIHHNPDALDGYHVVDRRAIRNIYDQWRKQRKSSNPDFKDMEAENASNLLQKRKSSMSAFNPVLFDEEIQKLINHEEDGISGTVLYYKKSGEDSPARGNSTVHELFKNDLCLILQTQVQKELLDKYCTVINLEEILGDELDIVGIVVLDEFLMSIPVGWMICSNARDSVVQHFFSTIMENSSINCDYLFSTRRGGLHKLWYKEFERKPRALYPIEDSFRELKATLRKFYDSSVIRTRYFEELEQMVVTPDKEIFEAKLEKLQSLPDSEPFIHVFTQDWLETKYRWAYHTRLQVPIAMEESFAKLRKFILFKGTKSIGKNIEDLLKIGYDKIFQHNKNIYKGDIKQQTLLENITMKHETSSKEGYQSQIRELGNNKYQIDDVVVIDLKTMCNCKLACAECGFCCHRFFCPCPDTEFCVHSHGLGIYLSQVNMDPLQLVILPDSGQVVEVEKEKGSERWGHDYEYYDIMCTELEEGESYLTNAENEDLVNIDFSGLTKKKDATPKTPRKPRPKTPEPRKRGEPRLGLPRRRPLLSRESEPEPPILTKIDPGAKSDFDDEETGTFDDDCSPSLIAVEKTPTKKVKKRTSITVTVIPIITTTPTPTRPMRTSTRLQQSKSEEKKAPRSKSEEKKTPRVVHVTPQIQPKKLNLTPSTSSPRPPKTMKKELVETPTSSKSKKVIAIKEEPQSPPTTRTTRSSVKKEDAAQSTPEPRTPKSSKTSKSTSDSKKPGKSKKESLRRDLLGLMNKIDSIQDEKVLSRLRRKMTDLSSVVDSA